MLTTGLVVLCGERVKKGIVRLYRRLGCGQGFEVGHWEGVLEVIMIKIICMER